eukprot:6213379-Pleurochrysis_carterae.AAC.6
MVARRGVMRPGERCACSCRIQANGMAKCRESWSSSPSGHFAGFEQRAPSSLTKRWTFSGVLRIAIDVLQLSVVDAFNKFRKHVVSNTAEELLAAKPETE